VQIEQFLAKCGRSSLQRDLPDEEFKENIYLCLPFVDLARCAMSGDLFYLILQKLVNFNVQLSRINLIYSGDVERWRHVDLLLGLSENKDNANHTK